jgi:spore germination cell wall hydrolase CwlJ-like protein
MADSDVKVTFGGDTSDLADAVKQAKAALDAMRASSDGAAAGLRAQTAAMEASRQANQGWVASLRDGVIIGAGAIAVFKGLAAASNQLDDAVIGLAEGTLKAMDSLVALTGAAGVHGLANLGRDVVEAGGAVAGFASAAGAAQVATAKFVGGLELSAVREAATGIDAASNSLKTYFESAAYGERAARLFRQENAGMVPTIGRVVQGIDDYFKGVSLLKQGTTEAEVAAIAAAEGLERFSEAARQGGLGNTTETLSHFNQMLAQIPGMTKDAAVSIETMMVAIPNYTTEANESLVSFLQQISGSADEAVAMAKRITEAFKDPAGGGAALGTFLAGSEKNLGDLVTLASRLKSSFSDPAQATAFFDAMIASIRQTDAASQRADAQASQRMVERLQTYKQLGPLGRLLETSIMGEVRAQTAQTEAVKKTTEAVEQTVKALEDERALYAQIAAAQAREATFQKTLVDAPKTVDEKIGDLTTKIDVLQGRLNRAAGAMRDYSEAEKDAMVRTIWGEARSQPLEGQIGVAEVLKNRADNGHYGDGIDGVAKAGNGSQFNVWRPNDPNYAPMNALSKDSPEYQAILNNVVEPVLSGKVDDPTKGALNYYNPDHATAPFPMNNKTKIGDHLFGTAPGAPAPIGALSDDDAAKAKATLQTYQDALAKLTDEKKGGTAVDQANLAIVEEQLAKGKDEVSAAEKLVAARKQAVEAAKTGTPSAQRQAAEALGKAELELRQKQVAETVLAETTMADAARKGSQDELDHREAAIDAEMTLVAQNGAQYDKYVQQKKKLEKDFQEAQAGGTPTDLANLRIARETLATGKDQVKAAEALVAAKQAEVVKAADKSPTDQTRAAQALAEAQSALRDKQAEAQSASFKLQAAQARQGSQEQLAAQLAALSAQEVGLDHSDAKFKEIEARKTETARRFAEQRAGDDASGAEADYQNVSRKLKEQEDAIKESARSGMISRAQETADLTANLAQQEGAERAYLTRMEAIYAQMPAKLRPYTRQMAELNEKYEQQRGDDANQANATLFESYRGYFERIGSTVSSSLMAIIERTGTWRQLMQNVAKQVLSSFIDMGVKWVADWAANQTFAVAKSLWAQAQMTTAAVTGEAARTGAAAAGAGAQASAALVGLATTVQADVKAVFAGVAAFLAPILGPAAVPVAAGVAGSIPALDIGAWNVPGDMTALIHRNELVMPAAQAGAFRDMLSNYNGGTTNNGGSQTNHNRMSVTNNINGARSPRAIINEVSNNSRGLAKVMAQAMREGQHRR